MSHYKDYDKDYQANKVYDSNFEDPKWAAIEYIEAILNKHIEEHDAHTAEPITAKAQGKTKLEVGKYVNKVSGILVDDTSQREVDTQYGPNTVTNFRMTIEGEGEVRVSLWGDLAKDAMNYTAGDSITLTNMKVNPPYDGLLQLGSCRRTKIQ